MTIELVVRIATDDAREVVIDADPEAPAELLADHIARWAGVDEGTSLFVPRTKAMATAGRTVRSLGLIRGDEVELVAGGQEPLRQAVVPSPGLELVAVGGPSIGARWRLTGGDQLAGRGSECPIRVDDAAMSRAHLRLRVEGDVVHVCDAGSTNGTFIDGARVSGTRALQPGEVLEAGTSLFSVQREGEQELHPRPADLDGYIRFNRPPRITASPPHTVFALPAPPSSAESNRLPLASALVPLVLAGILWKVLPGNPSFLVVLALSPIMAVLSFLGDRRQSRRRSTREETEWRMNLEALAKELSHARALAAQRLREAVPDLSALQRRASGSSAQLWQRRPIDDDFLLLRCGWGDRKWDPQLRRDPGGAEPLRQEADAVLEPLLVLPSVPLTVAMTEAGIIGLCGERETTLALLRWCIVQIATMHSPEEVTLITATGAGLSDEKNWLTWLPHLEDDNKELQPAELIAAISASIDQRRGPGAQRQDPAVVVVIDERAAVPRSVATRLLREGPSVGIYVLWLGGARNDLPGECGAIVELTGDEVAITLARDASTSTGAAEGAGPQASVGIARALAPLRDAAPRSNKADLPRDLTLFELLSPFEHDVASIRSRWAAAGADLRAPLGRAHDHPFILDLLGDGPHALVGGTTGAGKSELLQTLIASLALSYPPTRLTFLLIDYKGGAAFKDCVALPHTVGLVTDLDLHLSARALLSLDAEIRRRERLLRGAGARDVGQMGRAAPPRLLLMIDEFATLVNEIPSFVDGIVDIAQRGRSLGIHLVLATQRPAGVVGDAVRANTNLRIALRVADEHDSEDVIGVPDAAYISRSMPGRAYVRRGHNELEEIQTAFSGAPVARAKERVQVRDRLARSSTAGEPAATTQLETVVDVVHQAAVAEGLPAPAAPWLPPLPETLSFSDLPVSPETNSTGVVFGLIDRPDLQVQETAFFDLAKDAHLLVLGAGGSGKSALLRCLAAAFASAWSPDDLHLYGLDFGSGALRALEALPHRGDIVPGEEPDRVGRLFSMLTREVAARKALFAAHNVSDMSAWPTGGLEPAPPPRILVLLDGYPAFASAFERVDFGRLIETLPRLVSEGRSLGIHFVISTDRRAAVPPALAALIPDRVVLRLAEPDDYLALGLDARSLKGIDSPPGRGFRAGRELQVAVAGPSPDREAETKALRDIARRWADKPSARPPQRVALLPAFVDSSSLPAPIRPLAAVIGIAESTHDPVIIDLEHGHFVVAGPYRSGRSTSLETLALSLSDSTPGATFHLVAPRRTPLTQLNLWGRTVTGVDAAVAYIEGLVAGFDAEAATPLVVFIDDAEELAEGAAAYALEPLVKRARDSSLRFVAAAEARALQRAFGGWLSELRKDKQGLLLDPDPDVDGDLLGVRLPRSYKPSLPPGRGYLVTRGGIELLQVAHRPGHGG